MHKGEALRLGQRYCVGSRKARGYSRSANGQGAKSAKNISNPLLALLASHHLRVFEEHMIITQIRRATIIEG
jgi:hypothetical protein